MEEGIRLQEEEIGLLEGIRLQEEEIDLLEGIRQEVCIRLANELLYALLHEMHLTCASYYFRAWGYAVAFKCFAYHSLSSVCVTRRRGMHCGFTVCLWQLLLEQQSVHGVQ